VLEHELRFATIEKDLELLFRDQPMDRAILLLHSPPYDTALDRAALDGRMVDHTPLDVHVGSIAIRRFIEAQQPLVTLHGHIHESARLTGSWSQRIGRTLCLSAAHDGPELALVRFDADDPAGALRQLV
jgi:Icc-related predicted phosphoesterase